MLGLSVKSGPQVTSIEQPRVWINGGVLVERLTTNGVKGVSNLFSDLVYYLLTNQSQGVGEVVPSELVDKDSFAKTGQFLLQNKIHSNGVVETIGNIREFVTAQAGKHLLHLHDQKRDLRDAARVADRQRQWHFYWAGADRSDLYQGEHPRRQLQHELQERRGAARDRLCRALAHQRSYELPEETTACCAV